MASSASKRPSSSKPARHVRVEAVALAGHGDVLGAVEAQPHRAAGEGGAERRDRRRYPCGCISLPPKPPPIRRHCTVTSWLGTAEHVGDDLLGLGRVLGAALHEDLAALVDERERRVGLEVEVLLAGRTRTRPRTTWAAPASAASTSPRATSGRPPWKLPAAIASVERRERRQRLVVDLDRGRAAAGRPRASRRAPSRPAWPWNITSVGEQRLVVLDAGVVDAGHVGGGEHPDHAGDVVRRRRRRRPVTRAWACGACTGWACRTSRVRPTRSSV